MHSKYRNLLIAMLTILSLAAIAISAHAQLAFNYSISNSRSNHQVHTVLGDFKVEYEGRITVSNDDKDIVDISRGGYFELSKASFGASRKVKIAPDRNGLSKRYYVGWSENDYEPEGRKWLAEVLPDLLRSTTIAAESRVDRIYGKGGGAALVEELGLLQSDHASSRYFELAFKKPLTAQDRARALDVAGETVSSDHYLSNILISYLDTYELEGSAISQFLLAAEDIASDHYKTNVFLKAIKSDQVEGTNLMAFIKASDDIGSDHYMTNFLMEVLDRKNLNDQQLKVVLEQADHVGSDHYLSNIILKVMESQTLNDTNVSSILTATQDIGSDHYKTNVYKELFENTSLTQQNAHKVLASLSDINSDHYLSNLLMELLEEDQEEEVLVGIFDLAAGSIGSDHYLSNVLKTGLDRHQLGNRPLEAFLRALDEVSSGHYAAVVISEASRARLSDSGIVQLLQAAGNINSDHYLTESLIALAQRVNEMDEDAKRAYRSAAKNISSDTYYGKAMKALNY